MEKRMLERYERRYKHFTAINWILAPGIVIYLVCMGVMFVLQAQYPHSFVILVVETALYVAAIPFVAIILYTEWLKADLKREERKTVEALVELRLLQHEHPELVRLQTVADILDDEKALQTDRRSLWINILTNVAVAVIFLVLGHLWH